MSYAEEKTYPVHKVGPDAMADYDFEKVPDSYRWLVYWYEIGSYEGSGMAIFMDKDGSLDIESLSHCSCYGPVDEEWSETGSLSIEKIAYDLTRDGVGNARSPSDCDFDRWFQIAKKIKSIVRRRCMNDAVKKMEAQLA